MPSETYDNFDKEARIAIEELLIAWNTQFAPIRAPYLNKESHPLKSDYEQSNILVMMPSAVTVSRDYLPPEKWSHVVIPLTSLEELQLAQKWSEVSQPNQEGQYSSFRVLFSQPAPNMPVSKHTAAIYMTYFKPNNNEEQPSIYYRFESLTNCNIVQVSDYEKKLMNPFGWLSKIINIKQQLCPVYDDILN